MRREKPRGRHCGQQSRPKSRRLVVEVVEVRRVLEEGIERQALGEAVEHFQRVAAVVRSEERGLLRQEAEVVPEEEQGKSMVVAAAGRQVPRELMKAFEMLEVVWVVSCLSAEAVSACEVECLGSFVRLLRS